MPIRCCARSWKTRRFIRRRTRTGRGRNVVRAEVMKAFGYFVTESSMHMSIYVPYFQKRPELMEKYLLNRKVVRPAYEAADKELRDQIAGDFNSRRRNSGEYGSTIIRALETGIPLRINANVMNKGLITNLPDGCCVEVPCLGGQRRPFNPCYVGDLPAQLAALNRSNISVQELAVRGIMEKGQD